MAKAMNTLWYTKEKETIPRSGSLRPAVGHRTSGFSHVGNKAKEVSTVLCPCPMYIFYNALKHMLTIQNVVHMYRSDWYSPPCLRFSCIRVRRWWGWLLNKPLVCVYHHLYRAVGWLAPEITGKLGELTRVDCLNYFPYTSCPGGAAQVASPPPPPWVLKIKSVIFVWALMSFIISGCLFVERGKNKVSARFNMKSPTNSENHSLILFRKLVSAFR